MNDKTIVETEALEQPELEIIPTAPEPEMFAMDNVDMVVQIADRIEKYAAAMDTILRTIVKRAYVGDIVVHRDSKKPDDDQRANFGAAAAERIAAFVGIQEKNWKGPVKEWSDDHKHYTYLYEADFGFGNRWIHSIGKAGTRDKFFGKSKEGWKPLAEVQEDHIRTAAFRACRKEGVRQILGLRNIPVGKLQEMGFDVSRITSVDFESGSRKLDTSTAEKTESGTLKKKILVKSLEMKTGVTPAGKEWTRWDVYDRDNVKYAVFAPANSKRVQTLMEAKARDTEVEIEVKVKQQGEYTNYSIVSVGGSRE